MLNKFINSILLIILLSICSCAQPLQKQIEPALIYKVKEPAIKSENPPLMILLHGYGSNEDDLMSLAPFMPQEYLVVSARAPKKLSENSFAWYNIDRSSGTIKTEVSETENAKNQIITFIQDIQKKYKVDKNKVVLFGFSQGAILSYSVAFSKPDLVKGIAVMSGRLLDEDKPLLKHDLSKLKVFISHGTADKMLSIDSGRSAAKLLQEHKVNTTYKEFNDGHTINQEMMTSFLEWLTTL